MSAQSIKKVKRPSVVKTLETKLKIIADFEAEKRAVSIGHELGIQSITVRTTAADKQKYKDIAKLNTFLKSNYIHSCMCEICIYLIKCY
jgi:hypothetical protein